MKKIFLLAIVLLLFSYSNSPASEEGNAGIIYGDNHAFIVEPPEGWVLDSQSGVSQGLYAVFYPLGLSWSTSNAVMYVNTAAREGSQSVSSFIDEDVARFKKDSPDIQVERGKPITTGDGKTAEVRYFSNDQRGNSEAVAYVPEDTIFALIVLTARTRDAFDSARPAFNKLVKSYIFVTKDVIIEKK